MPIQKRLKSTERIKLRRKRLSESLPKGWQSALQHPLMLGLCYQNTKFNPTPENVDQAIREVRGWKGATDIQKVFVLALDLLLEKGTGEGFLEPDVYNRLWEHLLRNEDKLEYWPKQTFVWSIYHDHFKLNQYEAGQLQLPKPPRKVKLKLKRKRK